jgi:hypothetical protein
MSTITRPALLALAFSATVAAAITGLTFRGETKEAATVAETCARMAWPNIPARCLEGGRGHDVRFISTDLPATDGTLALRFTDAFAGRNG